MLKRITTGVAALTALGALALGGSVIASAKQPAKSHHSARVTHRVARAATDPGGGAQLRDRRARRPQRPVRQSDRRPGHRLRDRGNVGV